MFLSNASVKRPVAMCCLIIALAMLGINSYRKMGLELLPQMDVPFITILTVYPGASPSDIEVDVAKRIEDAVSSIDGLKHLTSSCMENVCQNLLEFQLSVDVNVAATDVREKVDAILSEFPSGVEKPIIMKFNINAKAVATMALTGDVSVEELYDYADNSLRDKMSIIPGVANVDLLGGSQREVHVLLDRKALFAAGLTSLHVVQAIGQGISSLPAGRVKEKGAEYSIRFDAEYKSVREIEGLQVAGKNGARRYIRDLGKAQMNAEERRQSAFINGRPCIGIKVIKKADANAVKVVQEVYRAVEKLKQQLPGGMELIWITDDGAFIQASVNSTTKSIWLGVVLTAGIIFCFLYNVRSTFVVAITMPLTIVISLFFMRLIDFTLNMSTLLALGLSVGVLVTNSIVVLESVVSHLQRGEDSWTSARKGTSDVAIAVLASAGTNIVVLFPIGMMGGVVGQFFKPFAWTTLIVNAASLFISFTITPILCAFLLKQTNNDRSLLSLIERGWNKILAHISRGYVAVLRQIGKRKWLFLTTLAFILLVFIHALSLGKKVGFSFVPPVDRAEIFVKLEYPTYISLDESVSRVKKVESLLRGLPHLKHIFTTVGKVEGVIGQASEGVYLAQILLKFSEKNERKIGINSLVQETRKRIQFYPDCIKTCSIPSLIGGEEIPIEMEIAGKEFAELDRIALTLKNITSAMPGFVSSDTSVRQGKPELRIIPRRPILSDIGAEIRDIGTMMRANLEGIKAGSFKSGTRTYDIRVKLEETPGKTQINEFIIPISADHAIILDSYAFIQERKMPVQITRSEKQRITKLLAHISANTPLGTAVDNLIREMRQKQVFPAGYTYTFRGTYERMEESVNEFLEAAILAILMTYLVLSAILESFTRPFVILTTIPLGLIGILWGLYLTGETMTIFVLLGGVMLVGIVVNNAVLVLDQTRVLRLQGIGTREAVMKAVEKEFRAVLMITLAAILGMLPLATNQGIGSEMCTGIGIASLGGIAASAFFTLLVVPLLLFRFASKATPKK